MHCDNPGSFEISVADVNTSGAIIRGLDRRVELLDRGHRYFYILNSYTFLEQTKKLRPSHGSEDIFADYFYRFYRSSFLESIDL